MNLAMLWSVFLSTLLCANCLFASVPVFTSPSSTTFVKGVHGTFTVITTASPIATLSETGGLPTGPVTFHDNGNGTATIAGTPTQSGVFPLTIKASNTDGAPTQSFILIVQPTGNCFNLINPATLPTGTVGEPYSTTILLFDGTSPFTFSLVGSLPGGLNLDTTTGTISGIPTTPGTFTFTIEVEDANGCLGAQNFTIIVNSQSCTSPITITTTSLPVGTDGKSYSEQLAATGGTGTLTFALLGGTNLPGTLTLSGTGLISGTVTAPTGLYIFTVVVTDSNKCANDQVYAIIVNADTCTTPITIPATPLSTAMVGVPYTSPQITPIPSATYAFGVLTGNLPPGLSLGVKTSSFEIVGTPTASGTFDFVISATDTSTGCAATQGFSIDVIFIAQPPYCRAPRFDTHHLPNGAVGDFYSKQIHASGGKPPIRFEIVAGHLPPGLFFDPFSGTISGIPTEEGIFHFEVQAKSRCGLSSFKWLSITIGND